MRFYTRAEIRDGTGWPRDMRFVDEPQVNLIEAERTEALGTLKKALDRAEVLAIALNLYGWHHDDCPGYEQPAETILATECDDPAIDCTCGFRNALKEAAG